MLSISDLVNMNGSIQYYQYIVRCGITFWINSRHFWSFAPNMFPLNRCLRWIRLNLISVLCSLESVQIHHLKNITTECADTKNISLYTCKNYMFFFGVQIHSSRTLSLGMILHWSSSPRIVEMMRSWIIGTGLTLKVQSMKFFSAFASFENEPPVDINPSKGACMPIFREINLIQAKKPILEVIIQ